MLTPRMLGYTVTYWPFGEVVMRDNVKRVLARVQSDYDFYVMCQADPGTALAEYGLTADEVAAVTDPDRLADLLRSPRALKITISGTHDWVNRTAPPRQEDSADRLAEEARSVLAAGNEQRDEATLRLIPAAG